MLRFAVFSNTLLIVGFTLLANCQALSRNFNDSADKIIVGNEEDNRLLSISSADVKQKSTNRDFYQNFLRKISQKEKPYNGVALQRHRRQLKFNFPATRSGWVSRDFFNFLNFACRSSERPCPTWSEWFGEDQCSVTCGGGTRLLRRYCKHRKPSRGCDGESTRREECNIQECPSWSSWSSSSSCSRTCGIGQMVLKRTCLLGSENVSGCRGEKDKILSCSARDPCPSKWTSWSHYGSCSRSCGTEGRRLRVRICQGLRNDSLQCVGESMESSPCDFETKCPGKYSEWGEWTSCDQPCGTWSRANRSRICLRQPCSEESMIEGTLCPVQHCNASVNVTEATNIASLEGSSDITEEWSQWSVCSASCGELGVQKRSRKYWSNDVGVTLFADSASETRMCPQAVACPRWDKWSSWSSCIGGCTGRRFRQRYCVIRRFLPTVNARELNGTHSESLNKTEDNEEASRLRRSSSTLSPATSDFFLIFATSRFIEEVIDSERCNGGYKESYQLDSCSNGCRAHWPSWSSCSSSCGAGVATSQRTCGTNDDVCEGDVIKYKRCFSPPCWTKWTPFSSCTTSCGESGLRVRSRQCIETTDSIPGYGSCHGNATDAERCNTQVCPRWGEWGGYSPCSVSCGGGTKYMTRICEQGICEGKRFLVESCNYDPCPYWTDWTPFTCCSVTCGTGEKSRERECRNGEPGEKGCIGATHEMSACDAGPCNFTQTALNDEECGIQPSLAMTKRATPGRLRIFGGKVSDSNRWPWQVSLQRYECVSGSHSCWSHFCGGTIVATQWILTAAHCIKNQRMKIRLDEPGDKLRVVVGMHFMNNLEQTETIKIKRIFIHPQYEYLTIVLSDIGLLKLERPVDISSRVQPACLPQMRSPVHGEKCFVTGWGYAGNEPILSNELREAPIPVLDFNECMKLGSYYEFYLRQDHHMCAGDPETAETDSCEGDSGGPLMCVREDGHWYIAGVTSFAFAPCGTPNHVGIYAPITTYEGWIRSTIENFSHGGC
ncbi:unnamed protein product [Clavelina lepadiformis]|uniref:Peptidase S1 domain-containing protein n=1 Tax=Clavelina lepadiformis TaxID=159417 RepID=A0ABP0FLM0_CLALP